jgi:hypothetical protein
MRETISLLGDIFSILGLPSIITGWVVLYRDIRQRAEGMPMSKTKVWIIRAAFGIPTILWLLYIAAYFGLIGHCTSPLNARFSFETREMVPVYRKTFTNEEVVLDGHHFIDCTFENVTFVYNGTAPFGMDRAVSKGEVWRLSTKNVPLFHFLRFLKTQRFSPQDWEFFGPDREPIP